MECCADEVSYLFLPGATACNLDGKVLHDRESPDFASS